MDIRTTVVKGYHLLSIKWEIGARTDISALEKLIRSRKDMQNVALEFTENSCLYTNSISVILKCHEIVKRRKGKLAVVNPNEFISYALRTVGIANFMDVYASVEDIGKERASVY
ncbi:MAG: hypothetical protein GF398_03810 [Chitinivibrionales bacterium]|nr:hypothetical protein [Chitinivibrionales bacterium]